MINNVPVGIPIPPGAPPDFNNPNDAILIQSANGISRQNEESQAMNDILTHQLDHTMEKDTKKDRLKKLHPSVLKLLLFASADGSNTVPPEVSDACERFINSETEGLAVLELNSQYKS